MPSRPQSPAPVRFETLDGLRGLCAIMVVMLHLPISGALHDLPLIRHSFLFVDFFFVLSGFVIAHSYGERLRTGGELRRFALARLARVYPLHLAMLLLFLAFEIATFLARGPDGGSFAGGNSPGALVANLLLVHAFGTVHELGWNYPSWSISAEFGTYLLFGGAMLLFGRRLAPALPVVALACLAALLVLAGHMDVTMDFGWLRCVAGFALGAFLRLVPMRGIGARDTGPRPDRTPLEIATVIGVLGFVHLAGNGPAAFAAPFVFTAAVAVFSLEGGLVSRALACREARFLGLVSYSVYMTQAFVISRLVNVAGVVEARTGLDLLAPGPGGTKVFTEMATPLAATSALLLTVAFSALTWRLVERPGGRLRLSAMRGAGASSRRALAEP